MRQVLLAALAASSSSLAVAGTGFPAQFNETTLSGGLTYPTSIAWAPDGSNRLFVTQKDGAIRIIEDGTLVAAPFATLADTWDWSECGLLSLAFDERFADNGWVYVFGTVSVNGNGHEQRIVRYTATGNTGTSPTPILTGLPTMGDTHNGGQISIGPDGKLYWAIGDNREPNGDGLDLDLSSLRCKVGRANIDGSIPNDNPFYDGAGPNNDYIWARGFRNPFAHTWQPGTGRMWLNDVGGLGGEQVFNVGRGDHGGHDDYGGGYQPLGTPEQYIRPVFVVESAGVSGAAIVGNTFYDATAFPPEYRGNYFLGDFETPGRIIRATLDGSNALIEQSVLGTDITNIVDVTVGPDGAMYYASYELGTVYRLDYAASTQALVVSNRNLRTVEGGRVYLGIRMARAPASTTTVSIARAAGDADLTVASGASLSFTTANWSRPQYAVLAATSDADAADDAATFAISSTGLTAETVTVTARDENQQAIVVSTSFLALAEGTSTTFTVRLLQAPAAPLTVDVTRSAGDADVTITAGTSLAFDGADWSTPQTVTVAAAEDADNVGDTATLTLTSSDAPPRTIAVTVAENDASEPRIWSTAVTQAIVEIPYVYDVQATGLPEPTYALTDAPAGMQIDPVNGVITWTPAASGTASVTVEAANGAPVPSTQSFTITVRDDAPPTASLTHPSEGERLAGRLELYGDGLDDAGTVEAEFYVDGDLVYTDDTPGEHYHYGGPNGHTTDRYDTTQLPDGPHQFRLTVYDAKGQSGSMEVTALVDNVADPAGPADSPDAQAVGCACGSVGLPAWIVGLGALWRSRRRARAA
jgi:glucose/arabinose dehydrogenase